MEVNASIHTLLICSLWAWATVLGGCSADSRVLRHGRQRPAAPVADSEPTRTAVVVDIDETLSDTDYFHLILRTGQEESRPLRHARETLLSLADDFDIIYLTCRPNYLFNDTRRWLVGHGFPDAPVHTANHLTDLLSPRRYKTRHLGELQKKHPNALIGIGDRASDGLAYQNNGMLSIIVNPDDDAHYSSRDVVLRSWKDVAQFFQANADLLQNQESMQRAVTTRRFAWHMPDSIRLVRYDDVDDSEARARLNRAILRVFPNLRDSAARQADGAAALADGCDLRAIFQTVTDRWPRARLVGVRLRRIGGKSVAEIRLIHNERVTLAVLNGRNGEQLWMESSPLGEDIARLMARTDRIPRLSFLEAIELASDRVDGHPYSIQLQSEYRRPTYEVALLCRRGFWEVDVDAASGNLQEVDRKWRLVPLH